MDLIPAASHPLYNKNRNMLESAFDGEWFKGVMNAENMGEPFNWAETQGDMTFRFIIPEENNHKAYLWFSRVYFGESMGSWDNDIVGFSIPSKWWKKSHWLSDGAKRVAMANGLDSSGLFTGDGPFSFHYTGETIIYKSVISYDFDEEFNRVATVKLIAESIPDISLSLPLADEAYWKHIKSDSSTKNLSVKYSSLFGYPVNMERIENDIYIKTAVKDTRFSSARKGNIFYWNLMKYRKTPIPGLNPPFLPDNLQEIALHHDHNTMRLSFRFESADGGASSDLIKALFQMYQYYLHAR
jgi:hypothetical protein